MSCILKWTLSNQVNPASPKTSKNCLFYYIDFVHFVLFLLWFLKINARFLYSYNHLYGKNKTILMSHRTDIGSIKDFSGYLIIIWQIFLRALKSQIWLSHASGHATVLNCTKLHKDDITGLIALVPLDKIELSFTEKKLPCPYKIHHIIRCDIIKLLYKKLECHV